MNILDEIEGRLRRDATENESIKIEEIGNTYVGAGDRFVVSLVVGYATDPEDPEPVDTPKKALAAALRLVKDDDSYQTHWYVFDRQTKTLELFEQGDVESEEN